MKVQVRIPPDSSGSGWSIWSKPERRPQCAHMDLVRRRRLFRYDTRMMRAASLWAFLLIQPAVPATQPVGNTADALLDLLVWGTHMKINPEAYDATLKLEIQQYLRRALAYRSKGPLPLGGEPAMADDARIRYER